MGTKWKSAVIATAAAVALIGAGVALAKKPDNPGGHGRDSRGRGGPHGGPDARPDPGHGERGGGHGGHGGGGPRRGAGACDAASSVIGAFVDAACPCDGIDDGSGGTTAWRNHGQYVRCVARAVRDAARTAGVKRRCVRDLVRCAARSTCGKRAAVTCVVAVPGACVDGACSDDADRTCTDDADCAAQTCGVTSAARCAELGGTAGTGSCCAASPSGAFLE